MIGTHVGPGTIGLAWCAGCKNPNKRTICAKGPTEWAFLKQSSFPGKHREDDRRPEEEKGQRI